MRIKNFVRFITILFVLALSQAVFGQTKMDVPEFYQTNFLKSDYKQVDAVIYVDIKERKLMDSLGNSDCENDKGTGYCLYLLTAEIKEVFKGNIKTKTLEFYISPDAGYPKKNLMGEKLVFLNWNSNYKNKKKSLGTLENSTRSIEHDVLVSMRKIAKKKGK